MVSRQELLNQLVERIREEGSFVLATPEDANYFRKTLQPKSPPSVVTPPPVPSLLPPISAIPSGGAGVSPTRSDIIHPTSDIPSTRSDIIHHTSDISDFAALRQILNHVAPEMRILNEMPSDEIARKIAERWKTKNQSAPISILSYQEPPEQKALLEQLTKALDVYFGPARIIQAETIEKEKQWGAFLETAGLKTILICDYALWQLNGLMHFYKETPAQGKRVLGSVPLFLLPDLSLYLKDPLLKRSLWKALCQKLS